MFTSKILPALILQICCLVSFSQSTITTQVLVVGGGTSGVAAGIQSARLGVQTLIMEETPWLGGMLTAAGVSATDGNHLLPSGIWGEFRQRIYDHYGGAGKVATGWVSNTHFEPHVAASIFESMAKAEKNLNVLHGFRFFEVIKNGLFTKGARFLDITKGDTLTVLSSQLIDATELGDVMAAAGIPVDIGMEASSITGENVNIARSNNIIQDLTYVTVLKDYGKGADCTIAKPVGYDPREFDGACIEFYKDQSRIKPGISCSKMLTYAKLPGGKYMLNWPAYGNDIYLNVIELDAEKRSSELVKAKQQTLRYVYFIQHELGYKNLGLADDEFPTIDRLALIPYHREGRRMQGLVRFKLQHIGDPFNESHPLYRTGIAVGDYPVDQHHRKNPDAPQHLSFYPIPSFNVPLGSLIPATHKGIIVAEKGISVSNVVNGATRLQPCVLLIGQAAGALAALTVKGSYLEAKEVPVRSVQMALLAAGAYLMPYADVTPTHSHFSSIQRIGAVGLIKGVGQPGGWANRTWFYPDSTLSVDSFLKQLPGDLFIKPGKASFNKQLNAVSLNFLLHWMGEFSRVSTLNNQAAVKKISEEKMKCKVQKNWQNWGLNDFGYDRALKRSEIAVLIDKILNPFERIPVNHQGKVN